MLKETIKKVRECDEVDEEGEKEGTIRRKEEEREEEEKRRREKEG